MTCAHESFVVLGDVARLTETDDDGPVIAYSIAITVECADCHEPFCFRGLSLGVSQLSPTQSLDGTTLTAPIHPMSDPTTGIGLPGIGVTIRDGSGS